MASYPVWNPEPDQCKVQRREDFGACGYKLDHDGPHSFESDEMKDYRVGIRVIEYGVVKVKASDESTAIEAAKHGDFVFADGWEQDGEGSIEVEHNILDHRAEYTEEVAEEEAWNTMEYLLSIKENDDD